MIIDVIGIVKSVSEVVQFFSQKGGQELSKCELTLTDDSYTEIAFTIWGALSERAAIEYLNNPVVAIRSARVSNYNGKLIGSSTDVTINPVHLSEAKHMKTWWKQIGSTNNSRLAVW
jgi:Replication protein A OB domain